MKFKLVSCLISCFLFAHPSFAASELKCPSSGSIRYIPLNQTESSGSQYIVENSQYIEINGEPWLIAIGMFDVATKEEAFNAAKTELANIRPPILTKPKLLEAGDQEWWVCTYRSSNPNIRAIAFTPAKKEALQSMRAKDIEEKVS